MLLNSPIVTIALGLVMSYSLVAVAADQCALVDCDCGALMEARWQNECQSRESMIVSQCRSSGGVVQAYCGLHGPEAFPVATSIQGIKDVSAGEESSAFLLKQVNTQTWSLGETIKTFTAALTSKQFARAGQLSGLIETESQQLYKMQKRALAALLGEGSIRDARKVANQYALEGAELGLSLSNLSQQLWQDIGSNTAWEDQRATKVLSFKTARAAAAAHEFAGDLFGQADASGNAARQWQQAAALSQKLIGWESITENNSKHIEFYQAQAASRWYRAAFHWLQNQDLQEVARSNAQARAYSPVEQEVAHADRLHALDLDDMRAIKRGD